MEYRSAKSLISAKVVYVFGNFPLSLYFDLESYKYNLCTKIRIRITSLCVDCSTAFFVTVCPRAEDDMGVITLCVSFVFCARHTLAVLLIINLPSHRSASSSSFPEILCPWTRTTFVALIYSSMTTSLCCHRKLSFHTVDEKYVLNFKI